jgi:hypothetical protein
MYTWNTTTTPPIIKAVRTSDGELQIDPTTKQRHTDRHKSMAFKEKYRGYHLFN